VLGLAELRLEVVGAGDAEAPLAFLSEDRADVPAQAAAGAGFGASSTG
jgi:hypothetical protein